MYSDDGEELIVPGDKQEIEEFIKSSSSCCKTKIDIFLPTVSLHFKSKHIYELIYNRINNDLLLWEPTAPKQKLDPLDNISSPYQNIIKTTTDTFGMCKSGIQYGKYSWRKVRSHKDLHNTIARVSHMWNIVKHYIKKQVDFLVVNSLVVVSKPPENYMVLLYYFCFY